MATTSKPSLVHEEPARRRKLMASAPWAPACEGGLQAGGGFT